MFARFVSLSIEGTPAPAETRDAAKLHPLREFRRKENYTGDGHLAESV